MQLSDIELSILSSFRQCPSFLYTASQCKKDTRKQRCTNEKGTNKYYKYLYNYLTIFLYNLGTLVSIYAYIDFFSFAFHNYTAFKSKKKYIYAFPVKWCIKFFMGQRNDKPT